MILNLSPQNDFKVSLILWWLCFKGDIECPFSTSWYDSLGPSWNGLKWSCKTTPFLPCQKQLCSQRFISVHNSLHDNELCSPCPSLLWKSKGDSQIIIKNIKCETYFFYLLLYYCTSSTTVLPYYCKVNPACFTCLKMINRWKHYKFIKSNQKVIKCNQLHYFNKVIEKLHYLLHFK